MAPIRVQTHSTADVVNPRDRAGNLSPETSRPSDELGGMSSADSELEDDFFLHLPPNPGSRPLPGVRFCHYAIIQVVHPGNCLFVLCIKTIYRIKFSNKCSELEDDFFLHLPPNPGSRPLLGCVIHGLFFVLVATVVPR